MIFNSDNINIQVPKDVEYILRTLRGAGYEAYIVGGCVRDSILGRAPEDWDITTSALPLQVKSLFPVTVDTGIQHGTVMVLRAGCGYEVTTYRIDGEYKDGRHPENVRFTPSLKEDLKRRDFTVNAFAYSPNEGVVDLFGGIEDLENCLIRAVGDPRQRFGEDALRIMRAVRFSAQLSFDIEEETRAAISEFAPHLAMVSAERIRVEFEKTLFSPQPQKVDLYKELGLSEYIIPDLSGRCFDPAVSALYLKAACEGAAAPDEAENQAAAAGSETLRFINLALFFQNLSSEECSGVMRKMTFDNRSRETVCSILKYKDAELPAARAGVKYMLKDTGPDILRLIIRFRHLSGADTDHIESELEDIIEKGEPYNVKMLEVSGRDIMDAGLGEGPEVGTALSKLVDAVIENPQLNSKEKLLQLL